MRTKKVLFFLLLLVLISFTTGCLGALFNNKPIIGSTPGTTAKVGVLYTYDIVATDPDASDVLAYSLSEKPTGMTINVTTGAINWTPTGAQVGEHQVIIEVSDGKVSVSQNFTITVAEVLLDYIVVVPSEMRVPIGSSETIISITAHYDNGTEAEIELDSDDVSYSSDDEEIATVSELGVVTGVAEGTAIITVTYTEGGIIRSAEVAVTVPPALIAISVLPEFMVLYIGSGYSESISSITASYDDAPDALIELSDATYVSDTTAVATVSATGVVTGVSAGTATITVTYTEGGIEMTDMVYITVQEIVLLESITVLPPTMEINLDVDDTDEITNITANYSDTSTEVILLDSDDVSYSSDDEEIATVSELGVVTGVSVGTATIIVSYTETGITRTDTVDITVIDIPE